MSERVNLSEAVLTREYGFEEGVREIMTRINSLLLQKDYVVVAISGPTSDDTNVGKTFLETNLARMAREQGISCVVAADEEVLKAAPLSKQMDKGLIILGAMDSPSGFDDPEKVARFSSAVDLKVREAGESVGLPISKVDIRAFIYRPDRPVRSGDRMYNNIIIRNNQAVNKGN